ncbi:serine hydrolase domain-containing protein [Kitasatospora sp. NPDC005856]|uniref:serine hydrolase domain-containing protein n=1 Tax=Kitasatospora sp. NPDC005856 TaxID=3154566 RepID=UPI0033D06CD1
MTRIRRPRPGTPRSVRAVPRSVRAVPRSVQVASAALALTGMLAGPACAADADPARRAGPAVTAGPAALGLSVTPGAGPTDGVVPLTPDVTSRLDAAIRQLMNEASIPGVIVGYTAPGGGYQRTFGVADQTTGAPMSPDMYVRLGSVTKTFTTTAVLRLADQGRLDLDDPVSTYVPDVPGGDGITLRQLGEMRSGLSDYAQDADFRQAVVDDPNRPYTPEELLAYAFRHPADFPPGTRFGYSNTNTILLGLVVEKVSGRPVGDFLKAQVFTPAGLHRTVFPTDATFPDPHPRGYTRDPRDGSVVDATDFNPSWGWASDAAISNLADLRTWSKALATGEPLLEPATQAERLKGKPTGVPGIDYGFGVLDVHGWVGHPGTTPGYGSLVVYLPKAHASLVILLNTDVPYQDSDLSTLLAEAITKIVTPNDVYTLPPRPTGSAPASSPTLASSPSSPSSPTSPSSDAIG